MHYNNKQLAFGGTVKNATVQQLEIVEVDLLLLLLLLLALYSDQH